MPRPLVFVAGLAMAGMAVLMLLLGLNLLPTRIEAAERGTSAPLVITWLMVWITIGCALVLSGFLFVSGLRKGREAGAVERVR